MLHTLTLATRSAHKTREFRALLPPDIAVRDLSGFPNIPFVDETGTTFEENASIKAITASRHTATLVIGDDSGLVVDALGGAPGVYSARYAGDQATDEQNIAKLLAELEGVPPEKRTARFRCVLVVAQAGVQLASFDGSVEGRIIDSPVGVNGFGYDPVFVPSGFGETFAQLGEATKNMISHRARASAQLLERLSRQDHPSFL